MTLKPLVQCKTRKTCVFAFVGWKHYCMYPVSIISSFKQFILEYVMSIQAKKCRRANKNLHMLLAIAYHTLMTTLHLLTPSFGRREAPNSTSFSPHQTVKDDSAANFSITQSI